MNLFSRMFDMVMRWVEHRLAPYYLVGLSFAESSFFPIPPDVMLAPMSLAKPKSAWYYATITTLASVVGGMAGYAIGLFAFELIEPLILSAGYDEKFTLAKSWFNEWGIWVVLLAGFSPIPYKVFTITAGVMSMSFFPFVLASLVGRGARFYLVSGLMVWGGEKMEKALRRYIDRIGWIMVVAVIIAYFTLRN
ncbi:MAG: DedA family protein [Gammaproteobacteria bacterium]|nr:DedA family protein [Gammaproteobacteria bacterium]